MAYDIITPGRDGGGAEPCLPTTPTSACLGGGIEDPRGMAQAVAESGDRDSLSQQDLSQRLTVIVTTSPVRSHPDTTVICTALNSFHLVPGLEQTRKLIVCDGYVVSDRSQFKKGRITPDVETGYAEYKSRLRSLIKEGKGAFCNTEVRWPSFGWSLQP